MTHEAAAQHPLVLMIDTPGGVIVRRVPSASPLPGDVPQGLAAEVATHDAAAVWGMPDFVFRPRTETVGRGRRELGDGFVVVGDIGLVLQVKSRSLDAITDDAAREASWITKRAAAGLRQARGTIRRMAAQGEAELENLRGRHVSIAPAHDWISVVVIDHSRPPEGVVPDLGAGGPAVVLLRQDWEFLFDQLKSTHAVATYLRRVADEPVALGEEPSRYYDRALDDAAAEPEVLDPRLIGSAPTISTPLLPTAPVATDDLDAHQLVRAMFEDYALAPLGSNDERDRLRSLAELDRLPVGARAGIGRFLLERMEKAITHDSEEGALWWLRSIRTSAGGMHLGYGVCSHPYDANISAGFEGWVCLRHHDLVAITGDVDQRTTVAALLTPSRHPSRPWDTTVVAVSGDMDFTDEELVQLRAVWPTPAAAAL